MPLVIGIRAVGTPVARWPGQEGNIYSEKIPSMLIYDDQSQARQFRRYLVTSWLTNVRAVEGMRCGGRFS